MPLVAVQPDGSLVHVVRDEIEVEFQLQDDVSFKLEELGMKTPPFAVQVCRQAQARGVSGAHTGAHGIGRGRGTRFLKPEDRVVGRKVTEIDDAPNAFHEYHVQREDLVQLVFGHEVMLLGILGYNFEYFNIFNLSLYLCTIGNCPVLSFNAKIV
jgi:hypothetical protein